MSLRGRLASSPRVAAASKPANDRNPNTTPRNSVEVPVPLGMLNTDQSTPSPPGAVWETSLYITVAVTARINSTVTASTTSTTRVPWRTGVVASHHTSRSPMDPSRNPDHVGGLLHTPIVFRRLARNRPPAIDVTTP